VDKVAAGKLVLMYIYFK